MPSRAAAIRELLKRGLAAEGFSLADSKTKSGDYGVTDELPDGQADGLLDGHAHQKRDGEDG